MAGASQTFASHLHYLSSSSQFDLSDFPLIASHQISNKFSSSLSAFVSQRISLPAMRACNCDRTFEAKVPRKAFARILRLSNPNPSTISPPVTLEFFPEMILPKQNEQNRISIRVSDVSRKALVAQKKVTDTAVQVKQSFYGRGWCHTTKKPVRDGLDGFGILDRF